MKKILLAFALFISFSSIAQPPMMQAVNSNLFADETEVTIRDWYVFMYSVVNEDDFNSSDFSSISMMPDTSSMDSYFKFVFRNASRGINSEYEGSGYTKKNITSYRSKSAAWFVVPKGTFVAEDV